MKKPRAVLSLLLLILASAYHVVGFAEGEADKRRLAQSAIKSILSKEAFMAEHSLAAPHPFRSDTMHQAFNQVNADPMLMRLSFEQLTKIRLDIWGISDHKNRKADKDYNERNWGYGGKYYYNDENFAMGAYIRNTQNKATWFMGHGVRRAVLEMGGVKAYVGIVGGFMNYETEKETIRRPMFAPGFEVEGGGFSLNFAFIPIANVTTLHLSVMKPF